MSYAPFDLRLTLCHDGKEWRLYDWKGSYGCIQPDFSNISDVVNTLLKDQCTVLKLIGEGKWGA